MKKINILIVAILMLASYSLTAQVAINTDGSDADASAMLEVKSTDKGFLPPRMTEVQMNAISNPVEGLIVYCTDGNPKGPYYFDGVLWVSFSYNSTSFNDVTNSTTGKTWMDRNLGAYRVATSRTDKYAYGDLYQWGRAADGHQLRSSATTTTLATTAVPNLGNAWDGKFIMVGLTSYDWLESQNNTLWQGVGGVNNPCPTGYRLPTDTELTVEIGSWTNTTSAGAYGSPLKFTVGGIRFHRDGSFSDVGSEAHYASSTIVSNSLHQSGLRLESGSANINPCFRAIGVSVRCIKD